MEWATELDESPPGCRARKDPRHIRVIPGDPVTIEVSPYDLRRGRITYRGHWEPRAEP